jgi:flavodoxin I
MATVKIFYGSTDGNTETVAEMIKDKFGEAEVINVADASPADFDGADLYLLGSSTWEDGQLQEDWDAFFPEMDDIDFTGKTVAIFGLGDAEGFSGEFVNAMGTLFDKVVERGGKLVGSWPTDGYVFEHSNSVRDGSFVGLAIDEDNESDMTEERVTGWVEKVKTEAGL